MSHKVLTVAKQRNYAVLDVKSAKRAALAWLEQAQLQKAVDFGLPEVDDRYHVWRVPLLNRSNRERIGEVVIEARTSLISENKYTNPRVLEARLLGRKGATEKNLRRATGVMHYRQYAIRLRLEILKKFYKNSLLEMLTWFLLLRRTIMHAPSTRIT